MESQTGSDSALELHWRSLERSIAARVGSPQGLPGSGDFGALLSSAQGSLMQLRKEVVAAQQLGVGAAGNALSGGGNLRSSLELLLTKSPAGCLDGGLSTYSRQQAGLHSAATRVRSGAALGALPTTPLPFSSGAEPTQPPCGASAAEHLATLQQMVADAEQRLHSSLRRQTAEAAAAAVTSALKSRTSDHNGNGSGTVGEQRKEAERADRRAAAALRRAEAAEQAVLTLRAELRGAVDGWEERLARVEGTVQQGAQGSDRIAAIERSLDISIEGLWSAARNADTRVQRQFGDLAAQVEQLGAAFEQLREQQQRLHAGGGVGLAELEARVAALERRHQHSHDHLHHQPEQQQQQPAVPSKAGGAGPRHPGPAGALDTLALPSSDPFAAAAAFAAMLGDAALSDCAAMAPSTLESARPVQSPHFAPAPAEPVGQPADSTPEGPLANAVAQLEARMYALEQERLDAAPVDGLTAGALEARIAILEDDYLERQRAADDAEAEAEAAARAAAAERQQGLAAAGAAVATSAGGQLSAVEAFGEQLNAVLERFAPAGGTVPSGAGTPEAGRLPELNAAVAAAEALARGAQDAADNVDRKVQRLAADVVALRNGQASALEAAMARAGAAEQGVEGLRSLLVARAQALQSEAAQAVAGLAERIDALTSETASATAAATRAMATAEAAAAAADENSTSLEAAARMATEAKAAAVEAAAAAEAAAATGVRLADVAADVEAVSAALYELRVETQNAAEDTGARLKGLEEMKDDLAIWQAGSRAAAERAERVATEAAERIDELAAAVAAAPAAAAAAAAGQQAEALASMHAAAEQARATADDAKASAASLQSRLEQLDARVADVAAHAQQDHQQRSAAAESAAAAAAAATAATAELTLRLQAAAAEVSGRIDALDSRLTAVRTAADAHAARLDTVEAAAAAASAAAEEAGRVAGSAADDAKQAAEGSAVVLARVEALAERLEPLEEAVAAAAAAATDAAAAQMTPPGSTGTPAGAGVSPSSDGSPPYTVLSVAPRASDARVSRFSLDSLDGSPSFAARARASGVVTYPSHSGALPRRSSAGVPVDSAEPRAFDNQLFGEEGREVSPPVLAAEDSLRGVPVAGPGDTPLSLYSNATFEESASASLRVTRNSMAGADVREDAALPAAAPAEGESAGAAAAEAIISSPPAASLVSQQSLPPVLSTADADGEADGSSADEAAAAQQRVPRGAATSAAGTNGRGRGTRRRVAPPPSAAAPSAAPPPESVALRHAELLEKGPSEFELAKQELERAAKASPGRVWRQAVAMEATISALSSDSETPSPPARGAAAGPGGPRRPFGARARLEALMAGATSTGAAQSPPQQQRLPRQVQEPSDSPSDGSPAATAPAAATVVTVPPEQPAPAVAQTPEAPASTPAYRASRDAPGWASTSLMDLSGSDADGDLLSLLPGLGPRPQRQGQQQQAGGETGGVCGDSPGDDDDGDGVLRLRGGARSSDRDGWEYASEDEVEEQQQEEGEQEPAGHHSSNSADAQEQLDPSPIGPSGLGLSTDTPAAAPAATANTIKASSSRGGYRIAVITSNRQGAGTDALVTLNLTTEAGLVIDLPLNTEPGVFKDDSRLEFWVEEDAAGASGKGRPEGRGVVGASVWHDGRNYASAWLPERVIVQELGTGAWWSFSTGGCWVRGGPSNARALELVETGVGTAGATPAPPLLAAPQAAGAAAAAIAAKGAAEATTAAGTAGLSSSGTPLVPLAGPVAMESAQPVPAEPPLAVEQPQQAAAVVSDGKLSGPSKRAAQPSPPSPSPGAVQSGPAAPRTRRLSGSLLPPVVRLVPLPAITQSDDGTISRGFSSTGGGDCPSIAGAAGPLQGPPSAAPGTEPLLDASPAAETATAGPASGTAGTKHRSRRHKKIRFNRYAEQLQLPASTAAQRAAADGSEDSDASLQSFTEEQLLDVQGEGGLTVYGISLGDDAAGPLGGYEMLGALQAAEGAGDGIAAACSGEPQQSEPQSFHPAARAEAVNAAAAPSDSWLYDSPGDAEDGFEPIPLSAAAAARQQQRPRGPGGGGAAEYRLRLTTGDRLAAGLSAGQRVCIEITGADGAVSQQLPRVKGSFGRGAVDAFTLTGPPLGAVVALRVWHEPDGPTLGGGWSLQAADLEDRHRGTVYHFVNPTREGWIFRGERNAVTLKPQVSRLDDEGEALALRAAELRGQLEANSGLSVDEKKEVAAQLDVLLLRIAPGGGRGGNRGSKGAGRVVGRAQ